MHALTLLKKDHKTVATLFEQFQKAKTASSKKAIVEKIVRELSAHAAIEEMLFYPAVREAVKDAEDTVLESLEEHHIVKWVAKELERMPASAERFDAKVKVLCENVSHHVKEEEQELFPKVRKKMTIHQLNELGAAMEAAKKVVSKHPHPRAPDSPPGNRLVGAGVAIVDRARDMVRGLAKTGVRRSPAKRPHHPRRRNGVSAAAH
ncbi:MAG: hemerythrin domain-containing protein [Polyangiales bacterium]